jgi:signal transduction histidine kinase
MIANLEANFHADIDAVSRIPIVEDLLDIICRTTGMGFAAIARVTDDRSITCASNDTIQFGLVPGSELKVETTICDEIREHHQPVVIDHVAEDVNFAHHHTPALYGFQSYISVPIMLKNGEFFGTLCAIDPRPAKLNNRETIGMFNFYADLLSFHLQAIEELKISESKLQEERQTAELREQFIAILGHDLRNPVGAVSSVAQLLLRMPLDERVKRLANIIKDSTYRMNELIENVLDFARGRLGEGIILNRSDKEPLQDILTQIIAELSLLWPERTINANFNLTVPVNCDAKRIAQLFSNLLSNALTHGKKQEPININISSDDSEFKLSVANSCEQISEEVMEKLFKPFSRGELKPGQQGLGLGLYISSEIARAHNGTLEVNSSSKETVFTLRIPAK